MQRGHLIAYDDNGSCWPLAGEAMGDILPHALPVGALKVIELPYGALDGVLSFRVDPATQDIVVLERYQAAKTAAEYEAEILDLHMIMLQDKGVI